MKRREAKSMETKNTWGGVRPNSGRKPNGRMSKKIWVSAEEFEKVKAFIQKLRGK
jgi:hypothetical protein